MDGDSDDGTAGLPSFAFGDFTAAPAGSVTGGDGHLATSAPHSAMGVEVESGPLGEVEAAAGAAHAHAVAGLAAREEPAVADENSESHAERPALLILPQSPEEQLARAGCRPSTESAAGSLCSELLLEAGSGAASHDESRALRAALEASRREVRRLREELQSLRGNIKVVVRIRPPRPGACEAPGPLPPLLPVGASALRVLKPALGGLTGGGSGGVGSMLTYEFDAVLGPAASQTDVYAEVAASVDAVASGRSACIMAYGQTGRCVWGVARASPLD